MHFHSKLLRTFLVGYAASASIFSSAHANAQTPFSAPAAPAPQTVPSADLALEAAKRAFESLPEADRVAMQDALIWTGDYKGIADGKFGKGTRDAIAAFASRNKLPADGTLDAKGRARSQRRCAFYDADRCENRASHRTAVEAFAEDGTSSRWYALQQCRWNVFR
jgi:peptidoglycan hydrolase-like protein with peptidoglycan-binding domain